MNYLQKLIEEIELHSVEGIKECFENGVNPNDIIRNEPLIYELTSEWETLIPAVNPISYAMMGLLPQMHRSEITISNVVSTLLKVAYGIGYIPENIPCAYLKE
ncbi:MAG: hypothetical protein WKF97_25150 [Chitinophagaceae bacterium]